MNISVVIPVYNESENIIKLVEEVREALEGQLEYEVIVVDDCSTDDTYSCLIAHQKQDPHLKVVQHRRNQGQSAGVVSGVRAACAEWIATLDGDGQNVPADILVLWNYLQQENTSEHLKMVAGHRVQRNDSRFKLFSSKVANAIRGWLLKDGTPDTGCGLKLFSRDVFLSVPVFDHLHRFLPAMFQREGWLVESQPVSHRSRQHGVSKYGLNNRLWVGIIDMFGVAWLQRRGILQAGKESAPQNK